MAFVSGGNELLDPKAVLDKVGLKPNQRIADLGCGGAGHFILPAAQTVGSGGSAYAVDILKSVLQAVSSKARLNGITNIKTVWTNLEKLGATKIPEASLDHALLINILFQSKKHQDVLKEAYRLLKPKANLLVIDWTKNDSKLGPPIADRVDESTLLRTAKSLNFKLLDQYSPGEHHFGLLFEKN